VSDSPALHSRWLLLLKIEISSIKFGLIWFSGFREEDLNVIFYQNMPNLHNRNKSAERNISQKNPRIYVKLFLTLKLQLKFKLILTTAEAELE
jgi:hypothetical protein